MKRICLGLVALSLFGCAGNGDHDPYKGPTDFIGRYTGPLQTNGADNVNLDFVINNQAQISGSAQRGSDGATGTLSGRTSLNGSFLLDGKWADGSTMHLSGTMAVAKVVVTDPVTNLPTAVDGLQWTSALSAKNWPTPSILPSNSASVASTTFLSPRY